MNGDGTVRALVCSYYVCCAKSGYEDCLTVTPSMDWDTRGASKIDASKWYCHCGARFRVGWGQLVVIGRATDGQDGKAPHMEYMYMRAEVPGEIFEDIRGMKLEDDHKEVQRGEELLAKIQRVVPVETELVIKSADGTMRVCDRGTLKALPHFDWYQIFNMVGVQAPAKKPKKGRAI